MTKVLPHVNAGCTKYLKKHPAGKPDAVSWILHVSMDGFCFIVFCHFAFM